MAYEYGPLSRPIEETLVALRAGLMRGYRREYLPAHRRSPRQSRRLRRIRGWNKEVGHLLSEIGRVEHELLPRIERDTGHTFHSPDGLIRILMGPSTKRLFLEILGGFPEDALPIPAGDLACLGAFADDARALAIIGDVTLRLKSLPAMSGGEFRFAPLCDRWGLYENRIDSTPRPPLNGEILEQEKEVLARAVLGLIYIEGGVEALRATVPLLIRGRDG